MAAVVAVVVATVACNLVNLKRGLIVRERGVRGGRWRERENEPASRCASKGGRPALPGNAWQ